MTATTEATVESVMSPTPAVVPAAMSLPEAARAMRDLDIGALLVMEDKEVVGLVTDRDLVVRGLASETATGHVGECCSEQLITVAPDDSVAEAVTLMRTYAVRRLPVVRANEVIGVVSIGDLAVSNDPGSALADITRAEPNR
jgi:CBS domain-containing protein